MERVEDFLREFIRARTEAQRASCAGFLPLIDRFFAPGYDPFNPKLGVEHSEKETVLAVSPADGFTEVITSGSTGGNWRTRYRLSPAGDSWRISAMEWECGICHGSGKAKDGQRECKLCKGKGWKLLGNIVA